VRPVAAADRDGWLELWAGYQAHFGGRVPEEASAATFRLFLEPESALSCLVAERARILVGFAHVSTTPFAWTGSPVLFLQDLFVAEEGRGAGVGRRLLAAVRAEAEARGAANVFWVCDARDERLMRFYRGLAVETPFVRFMGAPWPW
jgi:GNAT superfamily N-acetyltransferase